jgi:trigger factor
MKVVLDKREGNKVSFNIEIEEDKFKSAVQEAYIKNRSKFNIPGFRKGKVPKQIIEMNYGKGVFYEDAINILLPQAYEQAIEELELEPVDRPEIDIDELKEGQPLNIKIEVDVKPEVKLGDYKSIELEKVEYNVTDEMVQEELNKMQEENARLLDATDREVKKGDITTIDFAGYLDGEQFPGGTAEGHQLEIGSNTFIPGFEDQLIGKNKDEEIDVNVTFPEDYGQEELAGKEVTFKVTINDIKEKELPELDDEFAKDISEFDTIEEIKTDIKERLEKEFSEQEKVQKENAVIEKLIEISEFEVPQGMIDSQLEDELRQFDYRLRNQGLELEKYLEMTKSTTEDLKEQFAPTAKKRVEADIVLEAVVEAEKIEVSEEDIDKELEKMAEQYKAEDKEEFKTNMKKSNLEFMQKGIANTKAIEILIDSAKFNK